MKSAEIREAFLKYFEKHGHTRVKSSSLVPADDPTLFFTNAGMVQFKDTFLGQENRAYNRACSSQKCMRVSGKHNDLENVGHTPRHHTFFEMLGNFSFGGYFKKDAIAFAWEFLTKVMKLDSKRMVVTVFREDDEAEKIWLKHVAKDHIFRLDEKDNFWAMGDTGPCGPCSEILWDFGEGKITRKDLDSDRFMEIWNLVFMQFNRGADGKMKKLAAPSIDTGMGLERLAAVMQGVRSNWETDLFIPIINVATKIIGVDSKKSDETDVALRVIADHARSSAFLIADGVIPSNEGRGYVLRRIMRRAIRYGKRLGRDEPFLNKIVDIIVDEMAGAYPELATHEKFIEKVILSEEERFFETLGKGLELLKLEMKRSKNKIISGDVAFQLYDTFGFPLDVTEIIAKEEGFKIDEEGFARLMEKQRERARASWKGSGEEAVANVYRELVGGSLKTNFTGYSEESAHAKVRAILVDGEVVKNSGDAKEFEFVTDRTPFYGASGGQVGDTGVAVSEEIEMDVVDTKRPVPELIVHEAKIKRGKLSVGDEITIAINGEKRLQTKCNHTATHLLQHALREVLGEHVKQSGSLVEPSRFRFDFSHFQAMTPDEISEVENRVNESIRKNLPVITYEMTYDEAVRKGALAFFGEKYGHKVRLIDVSGLSRELCGGTHVGATGEIGLFKIISESSVAAGIRRIEALTGMHALKYMARLEKEFSEVSQRVKKLVKDVVRLERELKQSKSKIGGGESGDLSKDMVVVSGVKLIAAKVDAPDRDTLRLWTEKYRDKLGDGVVVLASVLDEKVTIIVAVSKNLVSKVHAGKIVQALSEIVGGKGGGRPDFAQGGGTDISKIDEALARVKEIIKGGS